jgi:hypothetical protein
VSKTVIAVLVGVIPALTVAAILGFSKTARRAVAAMWRRSRPDHRAIHQQPAWGLGHVGTTGLPSVRFIAACAPSRSLRDAEIDPDAAIRYVRDRFPGIFPNQPAYSSPREGVRFDLTDGTRSDGYAWVWATGRVDLCLGIEPAPATDGQIVLPILDILRPLALLASAVASPAYTDIFGKPRFFLRRRFDWFIGVGGELTRSDHGTVSWDDLSFPGRRPERAGTRQHPFCPPTGFARDQLTNWNPRRPVTDLLAAFLNDYLKTNGYHHVDNAITDTLAAFEQADHGASDQAKHQDSAPAVLTAVPENHDEAQQSQATTWHAVRRRCVVETT